MRVLVTGASRGIGRHICLHLARSGAQIAACGSSHAVELERLTQDAEAAGGKAHALLGDLALPETPQRLIEEAVAKLGGLDAVVSNAGIAFPGNLASTDTHLWDHIFSVNVRAPWLLAKHAHPHLAAAKGSMVVIASMSGMHPYPGAGAYSSSKAALIMLVRQLAQEWAADGIRVNAISPGMVLTPLTEPMYADPEASRRRKELVPMHRIGTPEDISGLVEFLLSPAASYITGQNVAIDGGVGDAIHGLFAGRPDTTASSR